MNPQAQAYSGQYVGASDSSATKQMGLFHQGPESFHIAFLLRSSRANALIVSIWFPFNSASFRRYRSISLKSVVVTQYMMGER